METLSYQKEIKANKEHRCNFCGGRIIVGENYFTSTHKNDGEVYVWKTHKRCGELAVRMKMYEQCEEGVTKDDFIELVSQMYFDLLVEKFSGDDVKKYSDVVQQLRHVAFRHKLHYVICFYARLDKETGHAA